VHLVADEMFADKVERGIVASLAHQENVVDGRHSIVAVTIVSRDGNFETRFERTPASATIR
jgi:hypothetical protein